MKNLISIGNLGELLGRLDRHDEAETLLVEAHEILTAAAGADDAQTRKVAPDLVELYESWGTPDEAAAWCARLPAE